MKEVLLNRMNLLLKIFIIISNRFREMEEVFQWQIINHNKVNKYQIVYINLIITNNQTLKEMID